MRVKQANQCTLGRKPTPPNGPIITLQFTVQQLPEKMETSTLQVMMEFYTPSILHKNYYGTTSPAAVYTVPLPSGMMEPFTSATGQTVPLRFEF